MNHPHGEQGGERRYAGHGVQRKTLSDIEARKCGNRAKARPGHRATVNNLFNVARLREDGSTADC